MSKTIERIKGSLDDLEDTLKIYFVDKAPALPDSAKQLLADLAYWLALVGLIMGAISIIQWALALMGGSLFLSFMFYSPMGSFGIISTVYMLFIIGLLFLEIKALPYLKDKKREGWQYLYYATWLSVIMPLVFFNLIGMVLSFVIGFYFLFQVREYFK